MSQVATLSQLINANATARQDRAALIRPDGSSWTHSQLRRSVEDVARALRHQGVTAQDRVVIVCPSGVDAAIGFLGTTSCAIAAPLNPRLSPDDFSFYLRDLEPTLVLTTESADPALMGIAEGLGIPVFKLPLVTHPPTAFPIEDDKLDMDSPQPDDVALVLYTSGTTSKPKRVPLRHAQLTSSARNIAETLELSQDDRCLNVMPLFHIHRLIAGLLASLVAGASVICTDGFDDTRFLAWLSQLHPTWTTAVPTIHQALLSQLSEHDLDRLVEHTLRFVRSSSSAMPLRVISELEQRLGVPVIEAYGMTEATHQITSNPLPPRQRKPGSVGCPTNVELSILDVNSRTQPCNTIGEIALRGATITTGYEDNPGANAVAFADGWFRTGDQGRIDADGYLFLTGRTKEMINRGGEKISPRDIDDALLDHPDVAQAIAFAVDHPSMGEDVAAAVVLKPNAKATEGSLRAHLLERISEHKVPSRIVFVDEIPKGPTGKLQRIGLAMKLGTELRIPYVAPESEIERTLANIWCEVLRVDRVGRDDHFFSLGGDSLSASRVLTRVTARMDVHLSLRQMFDSPTLKEQAIALAQEMTSLDRRLPAHDDE